MLVKTCRYLYELDEELFKSLMNKSNFKNILSYDKDKLHSPKEIKNSLYIQSKYSAKDILNYIVLFCKEFEIEDLVYFEVF